MFATRPIMKFKTPKTTRVQSPEHAEIGSAVLGLHVRCLVRPLREVNTVYPGRPYRHVSPADQPAQPTATHIRTIPETPGNHLNP